VLLEELGLQAQVLVVQVPAPAPPEEALEKVKSDLCQGSEGLPAPRVPTLQAEEMLVQE